MTDRKEDEVKLSEEEIDRLLIETLDDSSPGYMNTNEQENVDELVKLSELEEIERIKKEKEEQEEIERIKKETEEREEFDRLLNEMVKDSYPGYMIKEEPVEFDLPLKEMANNSFPEYNIKKEPVEFDLPLNEMANNSFPEYNIKKEPVEFDLPLNEMANNSFPEYNIKKEPVEFDLPLNEILNDLLPGYMIKKDQQQNLDELQNSTIKEEQSESSKKSRYEFQPIIPKRKRSAIAIPDLNPPELDPLQIAVEMVIKYHDFVDYTIDVLSEERGNEEIEMQKWNKLINKGNQMIESTNPRLKRLPREMERMAMDENLQKEYVFRQIHLEEIIKQLRDINAGIEGSVDISLVSNMRYTEKVLPKCLKLLRKSKEELSELIKVIEELKVINKEEEDDDEYDGEILLSESES